MTYSEKTFRKKNKIHITALIDLMKSLFVVFMSLIVCDVDALFAILA